MSTASKTPTTQPAPSAGPPRTTTPGRKNKVDPAYYIMLIPVVILFTLFITMPAVIGMFYSFTNYVGYGSWHFIGLTNYTSLFSDPSIRHAYGFTLLFAVVTVVVVNAIALALAVGLSWQHQVQDGPSRGILHPDGHLRHRHRLRLQLHVLDDHPDHRRASSTSARGETSILTSPQLGMDRDRHRRDLAGGSRRDDHLPRGSVVDPGARSTKLRRSTVRARGDSSAASPSRLLPATSSSTRSSASRHSSTCTTSSSAPPTAAQVRRRRASR